MQEESSGYEGVVDVGVLVPPCFDNPLKEESVDFLRNVLLARVRAIIPVSVVVEAYHVVTNYLGISRLSARSVLLNLLKTESRAFYPEIDTDLASTALDYATTYRVESWDGYLIALARKFGARVIFSLDEELGETLKLQKEPELPNVVNPFTASKVREYHKFLEKRA